MSSENDITLGGFGRLCGRIQKDIFHVTKRVTVRSYHASMICPTQHPLESCDSVIIGLSSRRYIIVRRDEPSPLRTFNMNRQRIRDLQEGDEVVYNGRRDVIFSIDVYD